MKVHEKSCTKLFHSFAINMEMVQMEFWTTSRKMVLGGSLSMIQEVYQHFQSIFGIYFTAQVTSFQEQITQLRGDTEGSKHMFLPVLLCFGSFLKCSRRRKLLSQWEFYKTKVTINFLHKEEDTLIATSISLELSMTSKSSNNWLFKKYSSKFSLLTFMWAFFVYLFIFFMYSLRKAFFL